MVDGAPQEICMPKNRFLARCCVSGKYNTAVVKWDYACTITGLPFDYTLRKSGHRQPPV